MSIAEKLFQLTQKGYVIRFRAAPYDNSVTEINIRKGGIPIQYSMLRRIFKNKKIDHDACLLVDLELCEQEIQKALKSQEEKI